MKYDEYRQKGMMISSRPIESAHRTALQRGRPCGQNEKKRATLVREWIMIKLRVAYRSGKFGLITEIFKKQAA